MSKKIKNTAKDVMYCQFISDQTPPPTPNLFQKLHSNSNKHKLQSMDARIFRKLKKQARYCFACGMKENSSYTIKKFPRFQRRLLRLPPWSNYMNAMCIMFLLFTVSLSVLNPMVIFGDSSVIIVQATTISMTSSSSFESEMVVNVYIIFKKAIVAFVIILISIFYRNTKVGGGMPWNSKEKEYIKFIQRNYLQDDENQNSLKQKIMEKKDKYAKILSKAIQIPTISYDPVLSSPGSDQKTDTSLLIEFHAHLQKSFPIIHDQYPPKIINGYSLLYHIPGSNPKLKPILLCSHMDVVPAFNDNNTWTHDPFTGKIENGVIWGRGAIDNKHNVVGQLGAMEELLQSNLPVQRSIYIAIGHDEEIGGFEGASNISTYLKEQNIQFEFILDEGTMIVSEALPGFKDSIAMIGNAEKGNITVEMSITGPGGHSSIPPLREENLISIMGKAVQKISRNPMPAHFEKGSSFRSLFEFVAIQLVFPLNAICSNFWFFGPLMKRVFLSSSNGAAASLRTTSAVTVIKGGSKFNVIPNQVKAYINHRVHPLDTIENVLAYDKKIVNDSRIQFRILDEFGVLPPSPISPVTSSSFRTIQKSVETVFNAPSGPSLMIGNTDTRWYWDLSKNIYRFSPLRIKVKDLSMFHGLNERIDIDSLADIVLFYAVLIMISCDQRDRIESSSRGD